MTLGFRLHPFAKDRVVFIVPPNSPRPNWPLAKTSDPNSLASTNGFANDGVNATFIRMSKPITDKGLTTSINSDPNDSFYVEACQSSTQVGVVTDKDPDLLPQEIGCNSWRMAVTLRQRSFSYNRYVEYTSTLLFQTTESLYPLLLLSPQQYNEIPKVGSVFR